MPHRPEKSLESWIWDATCSIRGAKDASKFKDYILPHMFIKHLSDVFYDELNRIAVDVGSHAKAFKLVKPDYKLVRYYLSRKPKNPDQPVWLFIGNLTEKVGEDLFHTLLLQLKTAQIRVNDLDLSELEPILSKASI